MYFTWCLVLIALSVLPGAALLAFLPTASRDQLRSHWLWLAPAAGLTAVAMLAYVGVLVSNALTWGAAILPILLALVGAAALVQGRLPLRIRPVAEWSAAVAVIVVLVGLPFRNHIAPPDVDPQLFGMIAVQLKQSVTGSIGFPLTALWSSWPATHLFAATAGNETLVAAFSLLTGLDVAKSLVLFAVVWTSTAMLAAGVVARLMIGARSGWLLVAVIPFAFHAGVTWEYGDGAYARAAALAPTLAIVALLSLGRQALGLRGLLVVGLLHGATAYLLYRVFLWNTFALAVWMALCAWRQRDALRAVVVQLMAVPFSAVVAVLPIAVAVVARLDVYTAVNLPGRELFDEKHALSFARLFTYGEHVHGYVLPLVVILGLGAALFIVPRRVIEPWSDALSAGVAFTVAMLFVSADRLVLLVLPVSEYFLYSQMAFIANWSVTKLLGGVVVVCLAADFLRRASPWVRLGGWMLLAAAWAALGPEVWKAGAPRWAEFLRLLPDTSYLEFIYALIAWVAGGVALVLAVFLARQPRFATAWLLAAAGTLMAADLRGGRFNYPFLTDDEASAYVWLRENTPYPSTLVLTPSTQELPSAVRSENARKYFEGANVPPIYPLAWLPVVSERSSVFHRGVNALLYSGVYIPAGGEPPQLERLDWAFWNLNTPEAEQLIRQHGVTHVYMPAFYARAMKPDVDKAGYLSLAYESVESPGFRFPNLVYAVDPPAGR